MPRGFDRENLLDEQKIFLVYLYSNAIPAETINLSSVYESEKIKITEKTYFDYIDKISQKEIELESINSSKSDAIKLIVERLKKADLKKLDEKYGIFDTKEEVKNIENKISDSKDIFNEYRKNIKDEKRTFDMLNRKPDGKTRN